MTSISVALIAREVSYQEMADLNNKENIPEKAEQPVVETLEETCHDVEVGRLGTAGGCRRAECRQQQ